jgi:glycosyltransferase involved in cell wall biosynthesis
LRALWQSSPTYSAALRTPADRAVFQALGNFTALFELGMPTTNIEKVRSFVNYSPTITESTALKKKRIIFSNYDDLHNPYYAGGGAVAVHEVAKRLTHDSEVIVLTGTYPGAQNIIVDGVQYRRIGTALFGPKMTQLLFALLLPWYVMRLSFDVWVESFTPPFSTSCLQLFTRKKVIGLVHMLAGEDMRRKYHLPFHSVERQGLKTYKRFIVLTDAVAKTIRGINPKASIAIINNGVDFPEVKSSLDEKKYITYIGRIEMDQKGLDLLLEGFARVADRIPYTLAIAGTGISKEVAKLQALITKLGLQHKVKLFGRVSGLEKSAMLNASLFTVLPSRQETFSLFALESLSYGLPLVTFDIEGLQWLPDDCCIKISSFNYELLGEKMLSLALYPERYAGIAKQGKGHIELFNWDDVAHRYRESILATV